MMENHSNNEKTVYTLNEYVSYGTSGVCKIESLEQRSFDGEHEESYYKLRPLDNSNSTFYVPIDRAAERLRPLLTKEQIYRAVWSEDYLLDDSNIMAFIRKLRKKIEPDPDAPRYILTLWGIGYKFNDQL